MDRTKAFTEYGGILQDAEDWLVYGYRRNHEESEVLPPVVPIRESSGFSGEQSPLSAAPEAPVGPVNQPLSTGDKSPEPETSETPAPSAGFPEAHPASGSGRDSLEQIGSEIADCTGCNLYLTRQNTVPGTGTTPAVIMIVTPPPADSAGPGSQPLALYEYEYLCKWLRALDLDPQRDIFITPALKCRTPAGRPPNPGETAACQPYLRRQYKAVRPRAVLALGSAACAALTGNPSDFASLAGRDWTWGSVPALVLWTPAEVLANPSRLRGPVWESLKRLKEAWNALPGSQL